MTQINKELDLEVRPKLFLIHGWNMPPLIWNPLVEKLQQDFDVQVATLPGYRPTIEYVGEPRDRQKSVENALSSLLEQAPERSHWCGWSLGATLAMQAAIAEPGRISKLTLISPTARFFQTDDWPHGASVSVFDRLLQITLKKYSSGLKSFLQMQLIADDHTNLVNQLAKNINDNQPSDLALQAGYATLNDTDLRDHLTQIQIPTQVIAAESDNVISPTASRFCAEQIPNATFQKVGDCHCLPVTQPTELAKLLKKFADETPKPFGNTIDREQVARQFSSAAQTYDSAAELQRGMGRYLIDQIAPSASGVLIDLGCGTGEALQQIQIRLPALQLIGVDFASAMIELARSRVPESKFLVTDIEQTGLPQESANIVFSCAAMQWCDPDLAAAEAARLLKPNGQFLMSTFVSGTLPEFREAWNRVRPDLNRVHDLVSENDWRRALTRAGFEIRQLTHTQRCQTFASVDELLSQFRKLGANYAGYDRTPLSRSDYQNFRQQLGELVGASPKLTYECLTVIAKKPVQ